MSPPSANYYHGRRKGFWVKGRWISLPREGLQAISTTKFIPIADVRVILNPMKSVLCIALALAVSEVRSQTPTPPQVPGIILPSQQRKQEDSKTLAGSPLPLTFNALGSMSSEMVAYFPMDDTSKGGLAWSRKSISVTASRQVSIRTEGGRSYADFREPGARLVFNPPLALGQRFTLAAWVETPTPRNSGVIWHGAGGLLMLSGDSLSYWTAGKGGAYAKTTAPLNGWHHMAVVCDGIKTQGFLNGTPLDSVKGNVSPDLRTVGNHPDSQHHHWMMARGIDEQYFFSRPLTSDEIKRLMVFSPVKK